MVDIMMVRIILQMLTFFKRYETDEEFMLRTDLTKMRKSEQEERELKLLKQYMESYKDEVIKYMKELNLI